MSWGAIAGQAASWIGKNSDKIVQVGSAVNTATSAGSKDPTKGMVGKSALSGAGTGASIGATVGSIIPGVGTAIGAGVGAVVGGIIGFFGGRKKRRKAQAAIAEAEAAGKPAELPKENLLQKTDVGSTLLKSLIGSLIAGLIGYVLKDVTSGDKSLNFSAPLFGKETLSLGAENPLSMAMAKPGNAGINPYKMYSSNPLRLS